MDKDFADATLALELLFPELRVVGPPQPDKESVMIRKMVVLILALASLVGVAHAQFKYPPPAVSISLGASPAKVVGSPGLSVAPRRALASVQLLSLGVNERPSIASQVNQGVLGHEMHLTTRSCATDFSTCRIAGAFHVPAQSFIRGDRAEVVFTAGAHGRIGVHYVVTGW